MKALKNNQKNKQDVLEAKKSLQDNGKLKEIKNMNKNLKEDLSKIFTYHIDRWYNNEVNEEDINFKRVNKHKKIKTNLCLQSKK